MIDVGGPKEGAGVGTVVDGGRAGGGEHEHRQAHLGLRERGVGGGVVERGPGVRGLRAGQQPLHRRPAATVLVHLAGGLRGLLGAPGLVAQAMVAADVGPQREGAGFPLVELGQKSEVGLGALLVGAEGVPELDELGPQDLGFQVMRHGPLRDLPPPIGPRCGDTAAAVTA
ncbi:hypothetical protein [Streptomyces sp. WAC 06725]|uniref:hypothetical protein n=1 Tax=Streptomyces sp. WAC 06725 TaxID=2203209 RepID=UPI00163B90DD